MPHIYIVDYMNGSVDSLDSINDTSGYRDTKFILNQSDSKLMINPISLKDYMIPGKPTLVIRPYLAL